MLDHSGRLGVIRQHDLQPMEINHKIRCLSALQGTEHEERSELLLYSSSIIL